MMSTATKQRTGRDIFFLTLGIVAIDRLLELCHGLHVVEWAPADGVLKQGKTEREREILNIRAVDKTDSYEHSRVSV
jgi:hypothetical protein